jgi:di/tricarboxylate transporter
MGGAAGAAGLTAGHARRLGVAGAVALLFGLMRLLPPPEGLSGAAWAVAAVAVSMAILWLSEALPLAMTSVLPFLLLPLMGVMAPAEVAQLYWSRPRSRPMACTSGWRWRSCGGRRHRPAGCWPPSWSRLRSCRCWSPTRRRRSS